MRRDRDKDALRARLRDAREFCTSCGAGIGKFRRPGEGTCPACDPPREET